MADLTSITKTACNFWSVFMAWTIVEALMPCQSQLAGGALDGFLGWLTMTQEAGAATEMPCAAPPTR